MSILYASDVMLDPFPYGGGMTSMEGFAASLPIVTLPNHIVTGRLTLAMYREMGIEELVSIDVDEYVDIAVRLGTDAKYHQAIAQRIDERRHVLFEDARSVQQWRDFLTDTVRRGGAVPASAAAGVVTPNLLAEAYARASKRASTVLGDLTILQ